jgi:hypothetical protein
MRERERENSFDWLKVTINMSFNLLGKDSLIGLF